MKDADCGSPCCRTKGKVSICRSRSDWWDRRRWRALFGKKCSNCGFVPQKLRFDSSLKLPTCNATATSWPQQTSSYDNITEASSHKVDVQQSRCLASAPPRERKRMHCKQKRNKRNMLKAGQGWLCLACCPPKTQTTRQMQGRCPLIWAFWAICSRGCLCDAPPLSWHISFKYLQSARKRRVKKKNHCSTFFGRSLPALSSVQRAIGVL